MNGRLYRLTPAGGKPNHYTDSYASALAVLGTEYAEDLSTAEVGELSELSGVTVERVA